MQQFYKQLPGTNGDKELGKAKVSEYDIQLFPVLTNGDFIRDMVQFPPYHFKI